MGSHKGLLIICPDIALLADASPHRFPCGHPCTVMHEDQCEALPAQLRLPPSFCLVNLS